MSGETRKATVYLDADLHRALKIKAAETDRTLSDLVAEAVRHSLAEDEADIRAFEERRDEPSLSFADAVKKLKADGKL